MISLAEETGWVRRERREEWEERYAFIERTAEACWERSVRRRSEGRPTPIEEGRLLAKLASESRDAFAVVVVLNVKCRASGVLCGLNASVGLRRPLPPFIFYCIPLFVCFGFVIPVNECVYCVLRIV